MFDELAKAIGATIHVQESDPSESDSAVLDRIERSYKQAKAEARGEVKLRRLDDFFKTI